MDAKTYDRKTAAFAGFMLQHVPPLTNDEMSDWMDSPEALSEIMTELKTPGRFLYKERTRMRLDAVAAKETSECFASPAERYGKRNLNLDQWTTKCQEATRTCVISVVVPCITTTHLRWGAGLLGLRKNIPGGFGSLLLDRGYTLTLSQVEKLIERTEKAGAESTGLSINSSTHFFTKIKKEINGGIAIGKLVRSNREWNIWIGTFGYSGLLWNHDQFLLPVLA